MKKFKKAISLLMMSAMLILPIAMPVQAKEADIYMLNTDTIKATFASNSATNSNGTVKGDGVRLRKTASTSGTILELMYDGEPLQVTLSKTKTDSKGNIWYYCKRIKTGTKGYVSASYVWVELFNLD